MGYVYYVRRLRHPVTLSASCGSADLFLRIKPTPTTVHQGDLITYAFPVWNLGPDDADHEVLNTQVPEGTTFDYIRISGTPGLGTCTTPPYQGTGANRLPRKQRHGSEHHMDGATDGEGDGTVRHGDHRKCNRPRRIRLIPIWPTTRRR